MSYRDAVMTLMNWMTCLPLCTLRKIHIHFPDENIGNTEKIEIYETGTKGQKNYTESSKKLFMEVCLVHQYIDA